MLSITWLAKLRMKNDLRIEFTPLFNKHRKAAPLEIKKAFQDTLALFIVEPDHPSLRNHPLKDKFAGVRSIDVTGDWRALYRRERDRIIFVEFGTHDQLYGENF
jgi:addiction module RelE/StbE family toxin